MKETRNRIFRFRVVKAPWKGFYNTLLFCGAAAKAAPIDLNPWRLDVPTYDYFCSNCQTRFQAQHAMNAEIPVCGTCGGVPIKIILTAPAVHGHMARGRAAAVRTFEGQEGKQDHGPGCPCCH
jgi:putative FmdB family regulatory protein